MEDKSKQGGTYLEKWRGGERRKDPWLWMALDGVGSRRDRVSLVFTTSTCKWPSGSFYRLGWKSEQGSFSILHTAFIGFPNSFGFTLSGQGSSSYRAAEAAAAADRSLLAERTSTVGREK